MQHLGTRGVFADPAAEGHLETFGSFPHKFYLPTADMDLVYISEAHDYDENRRMFVPGDTKESKRVLFKIASKLRYRGFAENVNPITKAKVPIVKFIHGRTQIHCDLSLENKTGLVTQETFAQWKNDFPDVFHHFIALVKQFLVMRGLNDVHHGGLGGFSVVCLVYAYLSLHEDKNGAINLGKAFLRFLQFYGHEFNLATDRLVMSPVPRVMPKVSVDIIIFDRREQPANIVQGEFGVDGRKEKIDGLSIQDPNLPTNNISGGSSKAQQVFKAFGHAYHALEDRLSRFDATGNSILGTILGGNYTIYRDYHDRMRQLRP
jgi:non-canonical poly(A) RNA polymerase PAPD5/7